MRWCGAQCGTPGREAGRGVSGRGAQGAPGHAGRRDVTRGAPGARDASPCPQPLQWLHQSREPVSMTRLEFLVRVRDVREIRVRDPSIQSRFSPPKRTEDEPALRRWTECEPGFAFRPPVGALVRIRPSAVIRVRIQALCGNWVRVRDVRATRVRVPSVGGKLGSGSGRP